MEDTVEEAQRFVAAQLDCTMERALEVMADTARATDESVEHIAEEIITEEIITGRLRFDWSPPATTQPDVASAAWSDSDRSAGGDGCAPPVESRVECHPVGVSTPGAREHRIVPVREISAVGRSADGQTRSRSRRQLG